MLGPSTQARFLARHRTAVRGILLVVFGAVTTIMIAGAMTDGVSVSTYAIPLAYLGMSLHFGWYLPRTVDRWQRTQ